MGYQTPTTKKILGDPDGDYEQFLYAVSHDLQEPLRMVNSFLKLLDGKAGDKLDADARKYLDFSIENASRMKGMIYSLVELSRINRSSEVASEIDLNEVIQDLLGMFHTNIKSSNAIVNSAQLPRVNMIASQAIDLFKILIQNTFDNIGPDPLELSISSKKKKDRVEITLTDNGVGIKPVYLDKVFEMFKRTDAKSQKLGAGLAIAREIIKKCEGTIWIESELGKGTSVIFTLPLV
ncbi:MAG: light-regulated signal transduction histidine kinase (bacteriophytochrome) [Flavobacteriales bacterium]|jgi:chemotaxis family two-component system sensor kinase Cph1